MFEIIYSLSAAACWGISDFNGGLATRRNSAYSVVIASQVIGMFVLGVLALLFEVQLPTLTDVMWGALGGIAGGLGLLALYRGLSQGNMGVVAPVAAVVTVIVPVFVAVFADGLPAATQVIGIGISVIAVWFVSQTGHIEIQLHHLKLPVMAGIGFGLFMTFLDRAGDNSVFWMLVAVRIASIITLTGIATLMRQSRIPARAQFPFVLLAGIFDSGGNAFFVLATQSGRLDIAAVLSSLYPAATVMLAWIILKERLSRTQWLGVLFAMIAIVLISA